MTTPQAIAVLVASISLAGSSVWAQEAASASPYAASTTCSACHKTIHQYWSESAHAMSATRPSFVEALNGLAAAGQEVRGECLRCHAPTVLVSGDSEMELLVTREGVTCDFCHTVSGVDLTKPGHPFHLEPGPVKLGPLAYTESPFHETGYSALHRSSALLCAACHEYTNEAGVPVLTTYSEWWKGPYAARGETCQECHMRVVPGDVVAEGLGGSHRRVNMHRMPGGSVPSKLREGLQLRLDGVAIGSATARVEVVVTNVGVGHSAPSGLPNKELVVAVGVEVASGRLMDRRERTYRRVLLDASGSPVTTVKGIFLRAVSVGEDNRLGPKESKTETFTVALPDGWRAIVARLEYRDMLTPEKTSEATLVRQVRRER